MCAREVYITDKFQSFITVFMLVDTIIAETNMLGKLTKRRAVSPVIATVILVAVAITVAVAVSYWMSGIAGQYTSFEKVELPSHYSQITDDVNRDSATGDNGWYEYIELKNSGSKDATITNIFLNNIPINDYGTILLFTITGGSDTNVTIDPLALTLLKGESLKMVICIPTGLAGCTAGTTVDLKITTAAGNQYPILETLA